MDLRGPTELNFSAVNMAAEWARWRRDWQYYAAARELSKKTTAVQVGTFFNFAGVNAQEVASHFDWVEADGLPALLEHFEIYLTHCNSNSLRDVIPNQGTRQCQNRCDFYTRVQRPNESIADYLAVLRTLVVTCDFPDPDNWIREQLVIGIADPATRRAIESELTLASAVDIALAKEASRCRREVTSTSTCSNTPIKQTRSFQMRPAGRCGQYQ